MYLTNDAIICPFDTLKFSLRERREKNGGIDALNRICCCKTIDIFANYTVSFEIVGKLITKSENYSMLHRFTLDILYKYTSLSSITIDK